MRDDQAQARKLKSNGLKLHGIGNFERNIRAERRALMDQHWYLHFLGALEKALHARIARMHVLVNRPQFQAAETQRAYCMIELLDRICVMRIDRAEADQFFRMLFDVCGHVFIGHQHADMARAKPQHDGAVNRLHSLPMLVEIYGDLAATHGACVCYELLAEMTRAFPNMCMDIDNQAFSSYTTLNGSSATRRKCVKPAVCASSRALGSPINAPIPGPPSASDVVIQ